MKTEISRDSHQPDKRYSGVYQQQGRMLTDADWNELVDILKGQLHEALKDITGSRAWSMGGVPRHRALKINTDLTIKPGHLYVDGLAAAVSGTADMAITAQPDFPGAPATSAACVLYADVWERTVTQLMDERLRDAGLHGADTCTRKEVVTQIKWSKDIDPEDPTKTPRMGDATATITLLQQPDQPDPCDPCAEQLEVESRVSNYLFRLEVHDVEWAGGALTKLTLKWSTENGAIQCGLGDTDPPAHFTSDDWAYEFFDDTSERHLGVHLAESWKPLRGILKNIYSKPTGTGDPKAYARRWDGYCALAKNGADWEVTQQYDKETASPFDSFSGGLLTLKLTSHTIVIKLNQAVVAGDFWLAEVREAQHQSGAVLIKDAPPQGIEHRYLTLGKVVGGVLQENPEADRKYAFPPLTEMTRMFIAAGDGQDAMPGHELLNPLRVGVANGEWPVSGATVRFTLESGAGTLSLITGPFAAATLPVEVKTLNGLAHCYWKLGDGIAPHVRNQRVKAELLGVDGSPLQHPPVYFNANLSTADQVAYQDPVCGSGTVPTVHSLLVGDSAALWPASDGFGNITVKDVLDALLCKLKAKHIPFYPENCAAGVLAPTVKTGLGISGNTQVHEVLQKLICELRAGIIPYDPGTKAGRWTDILDANEAPPTTVQDAIDELIQWMESTDISYQVPDCGTPPTVRSLLMADWDTPGEKTQKIDAVFDKLLCAFRATHLPLDLTDTDLCPDLKTAGSVQAALKILCDRKSGGGCAVSVGVGGQYPSLLEALADLKDARHINICLLPGSHRIGRFDIAHDSVKITGSGIGCIVQVAGPFVITAIETIMRDCALLFVSGDKTIPNAGSGSLEFREPTPKTGKVTVENCEFARLFIDMLAKGPWQPMVKIAGQMQIHWSNNRMMAMRRTIVENTLVKGFPIYPGLLKILNVTPYDPATNNEIAKIAKEILNQHFIFKAEDLQALGRFFNVADSGPVLNRRSLAAPSLKNFTDAILAVPQGMVVTKQMITAFSERIQILIKEITSPDRALDLDIYAGGQIIANNITGYVDLCVSSGEELLVWDTAPNNKLISLSGGGILHLGHNRLTALQYFLDAALLKKITSAESALVPGYATLTVCDNLFGEIPSSLVAANLHLSGNQFAAASGEVAGYLLAKNLVVIGNRAGSNKAILSTSASLKEAVANILQVT